MAAPDAAGGHRQRLSARGQNHWHVPGEQASWPARMVRACHEMERCLGEKLVRARSSRDRVPDSDVADLDAYFRRAARTTTRWFSLHNGKALSAGQVDLGGRFDALKRDIYSLVASFAADSTEVREAVLVSVGVATAAYSGYFTPEPSDGLLHRVQSLGADGEQVFAQYQQAVDDAPTLVALLNSLPKLQPLQYGGSLAHPAQPAVLGWLNYWSAQCCEYLGFPDPSRDGDLLSRAVRTPGEGWLVKLTAEPLDIRRVDHLQILQRAYERFTRIGIRAS